MPKERTAKQKANDERLRQLAKDRREAKLNQAKKEIKEEKREAPVDLQEDNVDDLKRQIQELKDNQSLITKLLANQDKGGATLTNKGVVGIQDKYAVDAKYYPDPRDRLKAEPSLKRHAFNENYELEFEVKSIGYETKDGRNMREPKFELNLVRVVYDEDTGEPTDKRYYVRKSVTLEDPQTAIVMANDAGIPVEPENKEFLDEMRYLRFRDWLLGIFAPPKPTTHKGIKEEVIGGQLVQTFYASSEKSQTVPFDKIDKKFST